MKNAMKKLMSLLLVAVLLASVIPFAALAEEEEEASQSATYTVSYCKILQDQDGKQTESTTIDTETVEARDILSYAAIESKKPSTPDGYTFTGIWNVTNNSNVTSEITVDKAYSFAFVYKKNPSYGATVITYVNDEYYDQTQYSNRNNVANEEILADVPSGATVDSILVTSGTETTSIGKTSGWKLKDNATIKVHATKASDSDKNDNDDNNNTSGASDTLSLTVQVNDKINRYTVRISGGKKVSTLLTNEFNDDWQDDYPTSAFSRSVKINGDSASVNDPAYAGDEVVVKFTRKTSDNNNDYDDDDDDYDNSYADGDEYHFQMPDIVNKVESNQIRLYVYLNNNFSSYNKYFNIRNGIAKDGVVSLEGDVKNLLKDYYTAKDSDGLELDGIYMNVGGWVDDWADDANKYSKITGLDTAVKHDDIALIVVLGNAKVKSSGTADSSNPKTGDEIYMAVTVLGLSTAALATMYYLNKKRMAK